MSLSFSERGDKPHSLPLVLVHAFPLNRHMWRYQLDDLSDLTPVFAPDLPGFGESPVLNENPSMTAYAMELDIFLNERGIKKAVLGGCSMGGYILFEYWRQNPQRVAGMILCDTRAEADTNEAREKRQKNIDLIQNEGLHPLAEAMIGGLLGQESQENRLDLKKEIHDAIVSNPVTGVAHALQALSDRPNSTKTIQTVTVPCQVIVGEQDTLTPPDLARMMHDALPHSSLHVIPRAGHLSPLEQPEMVNKAVRKFLEEIV